jgi:Superinfection immunity protein
MRDADSKTDRGQHQQRVALAVAITVISLGYLLPLAVAYARGPPHAWPIGLIDLLLVWTLLGWERDYSTVEK